MKPNWTVPLSKPITDQEAYDVWSSIVGISASLSCLTGHAWNYVKAVRGGKAEQVNVLRETLKQRVSVIIQYLSDLEDRI